MRLEFLIEQKLLGDQVNIEVMVGVQISDLSGWVSNGMSHWVREDNLRKDLTGWRDHLVSGHTGGYSQEAGV